MSVPLAFFKRLALGESLTLVTTPGQIVGLFLSFFIIGFGSGIAVAVLV